MAPDDVPPSDMELSPIHLDEIDAATAVDADVRLDDVATLVADVRTAYLSDAPLRRSAALTEFLAGPVMNEVRPAPRRGLRIVAAATAGIAGKVLLGTAVAAASIAGLQANGIIDVPGLPGRSDDSTLAVDVETTTTLDDGVEDSTSENGDTADTEGAAGDAPGRAISDEAQANQDAAAQFSTAMQDWSACIDAAGGDVVARGACGDRPHPSDFGLGGPPAHAGPPEGVPGPPSETPGVGNGSGPPADAGPPAEAGPPADSGKPDEAGGGKPDEAGGGKPDEAGGGKP